MVRLNGKGSGESGASRRNASPNLSDETTVASTRSLYRWLTVAVVYLATCILVIPSIYYSSPKYHLGDRASEDIRARMTFSVVDHAARTREREAAADSKMFHYHYDSAAMESAVDAARKLMSQAREMADANALAQWAQNEQDVELDSKTAKLVLDFADDETIWTTFEEVTRGFDEGVVADLDVYRQRYEKDRAIIDNMPEEISKRPEDMVGLKQLPTQVREAMSSNSEYEKILDDKQLRLFSALIRVYGQPSIVFQPDVTERNFQELKDERARAVPEKVYQKGHVLVSKGERLDAESLRLLDKMTRVYAHRHYMRLGAILMYVAFIFILLGYYLKLFRPDLVASSSRIMMLALPLMFSLGAGALAIEVVDSVKYPDAAAYVFPAGIIGMLIVILVDARTAVLLVTGGSLIFSIRTGLDFRPFLVALSGGFIAVTTLTGAQERKQMLKAGLMVGLANALLILLIHFIDDPSRLRWDLTFWGLLNGLFCGIVTMPALWMFEKLFGVITDIFLLELTGLDHPLLQELEEKVPGSFQHALNVTKLAESAAKRIGANYLLVRAGAYYHDVGKIMKPKYFSENQISLDDKALHSKISPYMSAMIIKNHVKAGMDLARKYGLPERVIDFIPQHHGTTIIAFFYMEALKRFENSQSTDPVREADFRYPGPNPQSIETAIVMLADTTEATVTSRFTSLTVNEDALRMCVQKTITDKFSDGQFDECDLTLRDLHQIRESFVQTLLTRFHHRVSYPTKSAPAAPQATTAPGMKRDRHERT
jgi:cyclic-di-AMP phosphodiesterase PgpH